MVGRDTGSPGHASAVAMVVKRLLQPAGDAGGFTQRIPMHEVRVDSGGTRFAVVTPEGRRTSLRFLHEISVRATPDLAPKLRAAMMFRGYCGAGDVGADVAGTVVVCFANRRSGRPVGAERSKAVTAAGAAGMIAIDDVGYTIEPLRWPEAYARQIGVAGTKAVTTAEPVMMFIGAAALPALLAGSGYSAAQILDAGVAGISLPSFDLPIRIEADFAISRRDLSSNNVLAMLPGTDPALKDEVVVVSAHIDGYGIGEAVGGDTIYNGAFDDAAYVATLVRLAERRRGKGFRRPVLFAIFTGEEKGLLGARWFVSHRAASDPAIAANINLDAIRPLFPLKALTLIGMDASTLVDDVRAVAAPMGIEVRADNKPQRGMIRRTDAAAFLGSGIPGISFMFAYDAGSEAERRFREWYQTRYHRPKDDIGQPIDMTTARDFNLFFYKLAERVADGAVPPKLTGTRP